jgi:hypothetical protein
MERLLLAPIKPIENCICSNKADLQVVLSIYDDNITLFTNTLVSRWF